MLKIVTSVFSKAFDTSNLVPVELNLKFGVLKMF
jgi:hypothetical protein